MLETKEVKVCPPHPILRGDSVNLKLISELSRNLSQVVHPKKVVEIISEFVLRETTANACIFALEIENFGLISTSIGTNPAEKPSLRKDNFKQWFDFLPSKVSYWNSNSETNLIETETNHFEYISPILLNGEICGVLSVAFSEKDEYETHNQTVIDMAAQMAALSLGISSNFEATLKTSLKAARDEHRKFSETVLDALPVSLHVIDRNFQIVTWNRQREIGEQGISRESVINKKIFDVLTRQSKEQLIREYNRLFQSGKIERMEQNVVDENGLATHWMVSKIPVFDQINGEVSHVITVGEDVTQRVEAMQAVGKVEKLAAIGRLAAGVVHEINNPLATISACAEALEIRVSEGAFSNSPDVADLEEYLGLIRNEAFRCKAITNGLLDFSRARGGNRVLLDLNEIIVSSAKLIMHQNRGDNIKIDIKTENVPLIEADEGQMQQAIIALATNAIDAMPDGGTLTFRTYIDKRRVMIDVRDTGVGISHHNLSKIFEPFFTTKEIGKGTGLGLAVCYGIVTEHGGRLTVRSTVGNGTTFTISIPAHK